MIKKLCFFAITILTMAAPVCAIEYDLIDIDTLQTHSSEAIALNNKGQVLGWYNIKGNNDGKQFFLRNKNGEFYELPKNTSEGKPITWKYLTEEKVYGTYDLNSPTIALCSWDQKGGIVKLGNLPGKEISAINDAGQVLIKSISEYRDGKNFTTPVIWQNGSLTKLKGLEGELGIEGEESYGFDMNNKGEVVGHSIVYMSYKNDVFKQVHATKWVNGKAIDLYKKVPKASNSSAKLINKNGDMFLTSNKDNEFYVVRNDGSSTRIHFVPHLFNNYYMNQGHARDRDNKTIIDIGIINEDIAKNYDSIWMKISKIISINENGELIAIGETVYGEQHAMLLTPKKAP